MQYPHTTDASLSVIFLTLFAWEREKRKEGGEGRKKIEEREGGETGIGTLLVYLSD